MNAAEQNWCKVKLTQAAHNRSWDYFPLRSRKRCRSIKTFYKQILRILFVSDTHVTYKSHEDTCFITHSYIKSNFLKQAACFIQWKQTRSLEVSRCCTLKVHYRIVMSPNLQYLNLTSRRIVYVESRFRDQIISTSEQSFIDSDLTSYIHPVLQVVTGSESQVRFGVMKRLTRCSGSCRGPSSSSRPSNWPERDFLSLQSKVATSSTSIQTRPRNYGTNDSTARSGNHSEQHVTCLRLTFCVCVCVCQRAVFRSEREPAEGRGHREVWEARWHSGGDRSEGSRQILHWKNSWGSNQRHTGGRYCETGSSFLTHFLSLLPQWSYYTWTNQLGLWSSAAIALRLHSEPPGSIKSPDYVEPRCLFGQLCSAEPFVSMCLCSGGTLTAQDLAEYAVTVTDAWVVPLGEYQMYIPPPPAGGIILSLILNILKGTHTHTHTHTHTAELKSLMSILWQIHALGG